MNCLLSSCKLLMPKLPTLFNHKKTPNESLTFHFLYLINSQSAPVNLAIILLPLEGLKPAGAN